jgi:hypothetical protein
MRRKLPRYLGDEGNREIMKAGIVRLAGKNSSPETPIGAQAPAFVPWVDVS